jgi:DNA-binding MarR family transcriptional regulator
MKGAVSQEEFNRYVELYHRFAGANTDRKADLPDGLEGLSEIEVLILDVASSRPGISVGEIARTLRAPNSTLTSALDRLETKGLAQRVSNTLDRRSLGIRLTDKGEALMQTRQSSEQASFERVLARLDTHEEREMLFYLLDKMSGPSR